MNKKTIIVLTCLCIVIAIMELSGLPAVLASWTVAVYTWLVPMREKA